MPGIVLRHSLTVLGDCHLIDRFIPVIACPAGALLDAVNTIGQALGGPFAILADGDDVPLRVFGLVVTASRFEIYGKRSPFLRLLFIRDSVQCVLGQLNLAVHHGIADRHGEAVLRLTSCGNRPLRNDGTSTERTGRRQRSHRWTCPWCRRHQGA